MSEPSEDQVRRGVHRALERGGDWLGQHIPRWTLAARAGLVGLA